MNNFRLFLIGFVQGFKEFGHLINNIVNYILLTAVYFIGIGLTSLISKLTNKKFLYIKKNKNEKTYWRDLNLKKKNIEEYYRQF